MTTSELATVLAWHDALNARDVDTLLSLSSEDIEIGDAAGAAQGHDALGRWAAALPDTVQAERVFINDGVVVVEETVASGGGDPAAQGSASVATAFRVVHDKVTSVFRHDTLAAALAATDLTEADLAS